MTPSGLSVSKLFPTQSEPRDPSCMRALASSTSGSCSGTSWVGRACITGRGTTLRSWGRCGRGRALLEMRAHAWGPEPRSGA
eukprot:7522799-Pyramimonas_sp.AAC.1